MLEKLKKFDKGLAKGEAVFAVVVLLSLVLMAALQSGLRNLADTDLQWANDLLREISWVDGFMEKGTLWLAMLGASLATHHNKHIGIDILSRVAKPVPRAVMHGVVSLFSAVACFYFARVVLSTIKNKAGRIPGEFAVYNSNDETVHICVGTAQELSNAGVVRPDVFCAFRGFFDSFGITVNAPERLMDLFVPAMFLIIAVRFFAIAIGSFMRVPNGGIPDEELGGEDAFKGAASVAGVAVDEGEDAFGGAEDEDESEDDNKSKRNDETLADDEKDAGDSETDEDNSEGGDA